MGLGILFISQVAHGRYFNFSFFFLFSGPSFAIRNGIFFQLIKQKKIFFCGTSGDYFFFFFFSGLEIFFFLPLDDKNFWAMSVDLGRRPSFRNDGQKNEKLNETSRRSKNIEKLRNKNPTRHRSLSRLYSNSAANLNQTDANSNNFYMVEVKVVILGSKGVGKSSIIRQFVKNEFNEIHKETKEKQVNIFFYFFFQTKF